ncbi:sugar kinase [Pontibacter sp. 172403-2]|uniref:sugar kinase n=1 Tax=Pontibacter rufus TaxID=2791028 RepID=UPI0018AFF83F|nr:sugar kinase [Pontibacter sp. 172403-2]MBF9255066.1 sugar kinase [Pontibacter sp. 172403-2]
MGKVLSFGELLLRICPDENGQWLEENSLPFYVGGAEANVATALARWGIPSAYLTALPDNYISGELVTYLQNQQVQMRDTFYHGDRLGLYYLAKGKDLKNTGVIYDRSGSAFATLRPGMINWDAVFEGVSWFHFSAICPAITQAVADVCAEALQIATQKGITVSLDLNYRAKLWKYGKAPEEVMPALAQHCDLIMGNIWAAHTMLGIALDESLTEAKHKDKLAQHARITSEAIIRRFPRCRIVANTFRFDQQEQGIRYFTALYTDGALSISTEYNTDKILDKVGSGDCFMAGLIYGFYNNLAPAHTLELATLAAYKKLFIPGDATTTPIAELKNTVPYAN